MSESIPKYRQRNERKAFKDTPLQAKAYTVNEESRYILVRNIPALGVCDEIVARFGSFGKIMEHRFEDDHDDANEYVDVLWICYESIQSARLAKSFGGKSPFYGNILRISYCPEDESPSDTMAKLDLRRQLIRSRLPGSQRQEPPAPQEPIGPMLPSTMPKPQETTQTIAQAVQANTQEPPMVSAPKRRRI